MNIMLSLISFADSGMRDLTTAGTEQGSEYYKKKLV